MIPQAYTARDIADAYKWIQTLPPAVRDEMKTAEQMVLNYLKAKAMGQLNNYQFLEKDAQKKSQEFQKTLQNLKTEMDRFDGEETVAQPQPTPVVATAKPATAPSPSIVPTDSKSRQILDEIKASLNLSSDTEVIRMSLVLAQKALKSLL